MLRKPWRRRLDVGQIVPNPEGKDRSAPARSLATPGNLACYALHCTAANGMQCAYIDRRGRKCPSAWCPSHREVVDESVYCLLHAHTMRGIKDEFVSGVHPDLGNRSVPVIYWMAEAAADEIIAALNVFCSVHREIIVAEPIRRVFHSVDRKRIWEKQWKTISATGIGVRVAIACDDKNPNEIGILVNGEVVNVVPPPWNQELTSPNEADLEWLYQEVAAPVCEAIDRWVAIRAYEEKHGYPGEEIVDAEDEIVGSRRPWTGAELLKLKHLALSQEGASLALSSGGSGRLGRWIA